MTGLMRTGWLAPLDTGSGFLPTGSRVDVFQEIYLVFLILGTVVGVVVIAYMLYNGYAYRSGSERSAKADVDRPVLGELPSGSGGGRKLALSFALSTIIVVSLIIWTYGTLLYVETSQAAEPESELEVEVVGKQFAWEFHYENGYVADSANGDPFRVPVDRRVRLTATSKDVFHNFGILELRVKMDTIPSQTTTTWFLAEETGNHTAQCYELCGAGHSYMNADVVVMEQQAFDQWYASVGNESKSAGNQTATPTETAHD